MVMQLLGSAAGGGVPQWNCACRQCDAVRAGLLGWGQKFLTVNPSGFVLPCPTAWEIPGLRFDTIREKSLTWIWKESESFNRFRGTEWMPKLCRSCPQKEIDFGGCRCQAALLTGDPSNTDPACEFSPHHGLVREAVNQGLDQPATDALVFRQNP